MNLYANTVVTTLVASILLLLSACTGDNRPLYSMDATNSHNSGSSVMSSAGYDSTLLLNAPPESDLPLGVYSYNLKTGEYSSLVKSNFNIIYIAFSQTENALFALGLDGEKYSLQKYLFDSQNAVAVELPSSCEISIDNECKDLFITESGFIGFVDTSSIKIYDLDNNQATFEKTISNEALISENSISVSGNDIYYACSDGMIYYCNYITGETTCLVNGEYPRISSNANLLYYISDKSIFVYDMESKSSSKVLEIAATGTICGFTLSKNDMAAVWTIKRAFIGSEMEHFSIYNLQTKKFEADIPINKFQNVAIWMDG